MRAHEDGLGDEEMCDIGFFGLVKWVELHFGLLNLTIAPRHSLGVFFWIYSWFPFWNDENGGWI
jgi:hypothetical protein